MGPLSQRPTVYRDSYQGDPGIFGSIGRAIGGIVGMVPGVGSIVGGGITAIANKFDPIKAPQLPGMLPRSPFQQGPQFPVVPAPGSRAARERLFPGGQSGYMVQGGPSMSGYHYNKADYFLRDGTFVPAGTKLVKNRRRNPANSKATNRAISRVAGAKKHAQTLSRITIRKASCK
jgi:hypothetical protein